MENNRSINNTEDTIDSYKGNPPPYDEINDEFGVDKPKTSAAGHFNGHASTSNTLSTNLTNFTTKTGAEYHNGGTTDNFHNEFFQKPPKFLLYPTTPSQEDGPQGNRDKEFGIGSMSPGNFPSANSEQNFAPQAPPVFAAHQTNNNITGVPMSASQPQMIVPVAHHFITDSYLPRHSFRMVCPNCKASVNSSVEYVSGQMTHIVALVACWLTCCLVCVPYFINDLKDAEHFCPQCRTVLGYNRKKIF